MGTYLKVELKKNQMPLIFMLIAAFLGIQFMWSMMGLISPNEQQIHWGWMMVLSQMPIINAVLAPTFMAVIASRIADVEHKGSTLKLLYTLQSRTSVYHVKLLLGAGISLLVSIGQAVILVAVGKISHFEGNVPVTRLCIYYGLSFLVTFASYLLQLNLSLKFRNQMVPLAIGILGSFCGLFVMYLYQFKVLQHVVLWTNYVTMAVAMLIEYDQQTRTSQYAWCDVNWYGILSVGIWTAVLYLWGRSIVKKGEV